MTAPQPTPDSLAEFIMDNADVDVQWGSPVFDFKGLAAALQDRWLVLDPDDEATVDRIANAYGAHFEMTTDPRFCHCGQQIPGGEAEHVAQQILAALRGSR